MPVGAYDEQRPTSDQRCCAVAPRVRSLSHRSVPLSAGAPPIWRHKHRVQQPAIMPDGQSRGRETYVNKRQQNHSLPGIALPIQINGKILGIEVTNLRVIPARNKLPRQGTTTLVRTALYSVHDSAAKTTHLINPCRHSGRAALLPSGRTDMS